MSKISKTAQASMSAGPKEAKKDPFDTNAKKIAELRKQRNPDFGVIAVNRFDFIDALIEEYDKVLKENSDLTDAINKATDARLVAEAIK